MTALQPPKPTTAAVPRFLDLLPDQDRSRVAGFFYRAARAGATSAVELCRAVVRDAEAAGEERLIVAMRGNVPAALAFAGAVLDREQASPGERGRLRSESSAEGRARAMAAKPPSDKQLSLLKKLGHVGVVTSMREASQLIDGLIARERAS